MNQFIVYIDIGGGDVAEYEFTTSNAINDFRDIILGVVFEAYDSGCTGYADAVKIHLDFDSSANIDFHNALESLFEECIVAAYDSDTPCFNLKEICEKPKNYESISDSLQKLAKRMRKASENNSGCRLSSEEVKLLMTYRLPTPVERKTDTD